MGSAKRDQRQPEQTQAIDWDRFFGGLAKIHGEGFTVREIAQEAKVSISTARDAVREAVASGKMRYAGRGMRRSVLDGSMRPIQVYALVEAPKRSKRRA